MKLKFNIIETTINEEEKKQERVLLYISVSMGSDYLCRQGYEIKGDTLPLALPSSSCLGLP